MFGLGKDQKQATKQKKKAAKQATKKDAAQSKKAQEGDHAPVATQLPENTALPGETLAATSATMKGAVTEDESMARAVQYGFGEFETPCPLAECTSAAEVLQVAEVSGEEVDAVFDIKAPHTNDESDGDSGDDTEDEEIGSEDEGSTSKDLKKKKQGKKKKKKGKQCTCALAKTFPHRAKKCAGLVKGANNVAVGVAAVGALALGAAVGASIATSEADKVHAKETTKLKGALDAAHSAEEEHIKKTTELEGALEDEVVKRVAAEASLEEKERALVAAAACVCAFQDKLSKTEVEIDALVKQTRAVRPTFDVMFVLDVSGSMRGGKSAEMFAAVCRVLNILHPSDTVALTLFNQGVHQVLKRTEKRALDFPNCVANELILPRDTLRDKGLQFKCDGTTALWDAIGAGVLSLGASQNQRYLIVLTDGADCASRSFNRGSVEQLLHRSLGSGKFHGSFITVGNSCSSYVADLAKLATTHESLHHYNAVNSG